MTLHVWMRCWKSTADIFQLFGFHGNWSCDKDIGCDNGN
jgi:hypothetical protein